MKELGIDLDFGKLFDVMEEKVKESKAVEKDEDSKVIKKSKKVKDVKDSLKPSTPIKLKNKK